jgi:hypothetical protein
MNKRAALALIVAAAATPALAQIGGRRRGGGEPRVNSLEVNVHELYEDLKLTPEQEPLWEAYVDKVRALGNDLARERGRRPAQANLGQQIDCRRRRRSMRSSRPSSSRRRIRGSRT